MEQKRVAEFYKLLQNFTFCYYKEFAQNCEKHNLSSVFVTIWIAYWPQPDNNIVLLTHILGQISTDSNEPPIFIGPR